MHSVAGLRLKDLSSSAVAHISRASTSRQTRSGLEGPNRNSVSRPTFAWSVRKVSQLRELLFELLAPIVAKLEREEASRREEWHGLPCQVPAKV